MNSVWSFYQQEDEARDEDSGFVTSAQLRVLSLTHHVICIFFLSPFCSVSHSGWNHLGGDVSGFLSFKRQGLDYSIRLCPQILDSRTRKGHLTAQSLASWREVR
jgi:hypothetical protein